MDPFAGKPSKEQLENYFRISRQYFDQIAKQYAQSDPEYYKQMIAPFYGPFASLGTDTAKTGKKMLGVLVGIALLVSGIAAGIFVLATSESSSPDENSKSVEVEEQAQTETGTDYNEGLIYYNQKEYERAELYFKKVGKDDSNYDNAQKYLKEIKKIKEENNSNKEPASNRRSSRSPKTYSPK